MDFELKKFFKVWILAIASLSYCYYIVSKLPKGLVRLLSLLPVFYLFITLPSTISSFHLGASTTFFLVWLANFKLLLFAFDQGPLSPSPQNLFHFVSISCLPIKIKHDPLSESPSKPPLSMQNSQKTRNKHTPSTQNIQTVPNESPSHFFEKLPGSVLLAVKIVLVAMLFHSYTYKQYLHPNVVLILYSCHLYLELELILAVAATPARAIFGFELEPQFNEPYLTTSLQDFWGRRWNLMVTSILRPTVYYPIRRMSTRIIGHRWAQLSAVIATFVVSGLMHELIYYYGTRVSPTWEVTWFFVLHGICTGAEMVVKKVVKDRWRLPGLVSGPLTLAFVMATGSWLFFPQLLRNGVDERAIREFSLFVNFVKRNVSHYFHA